MQVVVRQHPFFLNFKMFLFLHAVVGKKIKQERKVKTLESRAAIIMI